MKNELYKEALHWLIKSEYDVVPVLDKKIVRIDLMHKNRVIKSDSVEFSIHFVDYLHTKIISLYKHFNKN